MTQSQAMHAAAPEAAVPMTPLKGLLVLLGVVVVVGIFITINLSLGVHEFWAAFLFLLYWTGLEHAAFDKLAPCAVGAVVGLGTAWLLQALPQQMPEQGLYIVFGLIAVLVYLQIMGWLTVAVNLTTMLLLTVGTIPAVQQGLDFSHAFISLGLGFVYFTGLVWVGTRLMAGRSAT